MFHALGCIGCRRRRTGRRSAWATSRCSSTTRMATFPTSRSCRTSNATASLPTTAYSWQVSVGGRGVPGRTGGEISTLSWCRPGMIECWPWLIFSARVDLDCQVQYSYTPITESFFANSFRFVNSFSFANSFSFVNSPTGRNWHNNVYPLYESLPFSIQWVTEVGCQVLPSCRSLGPVRDGEVINSSWRYDEFCFFFLVHWDAGRGQASRRSRLLLRVPSQPGRWSGERSPAYPRSLAHHAALPRHCIPPEYCCRYQLFSKTYCRMGKFLVWNVFSPYLLAEQP